MKAYFSINSCPANFGFKQPRYVDICHNIYVWNSWTLHLSYSYSICNLSMNRHVWYRRINVLLFKSFGFTCLRYTHIKTCFLWSNIYDDTFDYPPITKMDYLLSIECIPGFLMQPILYIKCTRKTDVLLILEITTMMLVWCVTRSYNIYK